MRQDGRRDSSLRRISRNPDADRNFLNVDLFHSPPDTPPAATDGLWKHTEASAIARESHAGYSPPADALGVLPTGQSPGINAVEKRRESRLHSHLVCTLLARILRVYSPSHCLRGLPRKTLYMQHIPLSASALCRRYAFELCCLSSSTWPW